jgi:hypothetical protein
LDVVSRFGHSFILNRRAIGSQIPVRVLSMLTPQHDSCGDIVGQSGYLRDTLHILKRAKPTCQFIVSPPHVTTGHRRVILQLVIALHVSFEAALVPF